MGDKSVLVPVFSGKEDDYAAWLRALAFWTICTTTPKPKWGAVVAISLTGTARDIVSTIDPVVLQSEEEEESTVEGLS